MKLYMALNEEGTQGDLGLHARLAVLTARQHTELEPVLLYLGERNEWTRWFEKHGVRVIDSKPPYADVIYDLTKEGRYWTSSLGHWLRTNVCLEEKDAEHVIYTDVDVIFAKTPSLDRFKPKVFSAAPEFQKDVWNYFNAGVMVANIPRLRADYDAFERYLVENIREKTYAFHDQIAYNIYYRGQWDKLPVTLNWKPYWGVNPDAEIIHFHGPKIGAIAAIVDKQWDWMSGHGRQIGNLFIAFQPEYQYYVSDILARTSGLDAADHDRIASICEKMLTFDASEHLTQLDLKFVRYEMFPTSKPETANLALDKPAIQSSTSPWSRDPQPTGDARGANNGIISGDYGFHTAREANPWWEVDLRADYAIDTVVIYNRRLEAARLRRFSILTSRDGRTWDEAFKKADLSVFGAPLIEPYIADLGGSHVARYIRIRLDGFDHLHFNECQVYGHAAGALERGRFFIKRRLRRAFSLTSSSTRDGRIMHVGNFAVFVSDMYHPAVIEAFQNGCYEHLERHLVSALLRPGDRVLEGGTAAGVVTMTAASIVGDNNVTTFEANPAIARDARANFARNGLKRIRSKVGILANRAAMTDAQATVKFYIDEVFVASRLDAKLGDPGIIGVVDLPTFCLEDEIRKAKANVLIFDIEGAEIGLLQGADLSEIRMIIMETHARFTGAEQTDGMIKYLTNGGFAMDAAHSGNEMVVLHRQ